LRDIRPRWIGMVFGILVAAASGIAIAQICGRKWPHLEGLVTVLGIFVAVVGSACFVAMHAGRFRTAGLIAAGGFAVAHMLAVGWIVSGLDHRAPVADFARKLRRSQPQSDFCVYGMGESPIVYYLGLPVHRSETWRDLKAETSADHPPVVTFHYRIEGIQQEFGASVVAGMEKTHPKLSPLTDNVVAVKLSPLKLAAHSTQIKE
jgi:hypothetical protein